jgi:hypothetical protein
MDIRAFLDKASKGRWVPAYKILRNATIFPVIVSALCDQPCRKCCQRTLLGDEAVALRDLEVACLRYADRQEPESYVIPPKDKHVVVIGAGLAGLSAALSLGQKRFRVTVFEKEDGWGGKLRSHPRFAEFDVDISLQFSAVDVEFRFGREIKTLDELPDADVIYVATGAGGDSFGLLDGWDSTLQTTLDPRVFMGGELCGATPMEAIAQGPEVSKTIEAFLQTGRPARRPATTTKPNASVMSRTTARFQPLLLRPLIPTATRRMRRERRPRVAFDAIATPVSPPARCSSDSERIRAESQRRCMRTWEPTPLYPP